MAVLGLAVAVAVPSTAQVRNIDIPGGGVTPRLAVPDCVPGGGEQASREACRIITEVLRDDLDFEGLFEFVDPKLHARAGSWNPEAPDLEQWRSVFASFLVVTRASVAGGELAVDLRVWALASDQSILQKRFTGTASNPRFFGHTLSDAVVSLTGYEGIARTQIAFTSDRDGDFRTKEIYVADYDGHRVRRLTRDDSLSILPEWSPDGTALAYTSYVARVPDVIVARPYVQESPRSLTQKVGQSFAPAWSPDGKRISYASNRSGRMKIWAADAGGGNAVQVTEGPGEDTAPSYSPTGREIAFTSNRSGTPQIWVVGAEGLNLRRLSRVGSYNDGPSWSPSKQWSEIAYTSRLERGRFDIAVVDLSTGQVRQITTAAGSCEKPTWSPTGRHLLFACQRGGRWQLVASDRLGRRVRVLPAGPGNNSQPAWGPLRR